MMRPASIDAKQDGAHMPRSTYIYIVWMGEVPAKAFTVKHECYSWLKRQKAGIADQLLITRVRDGGQDDGEGRTISANQFIASFEPQQTQAGNS